MEEDNEENFEQKWRANVNFRSMSTTVFRGVKTEERGRDLMKVMERGGRNWKEIWRLVSTGEIKGYTPLRPFDPSPTSTPSIFTKESSRNKPPAFTFPFTLVKRRVFLPLRFLSISDNDISKRLTGIKK